MTENNQFLVDFNKLPTKIDLTDEIELNENGQCQISILPKIIRKHPPTKFNYYLVITKKDGKK